MLCELFVFNHFIFYQKIQIMYESYIQSPKSSSSGFILLQRISLSDAPDLFAQCFYCIQSVYINGYHSGYSAIFILFIIYQIFLLMIPLPNERISRFPSAKESKKSNYFKLWDFLLKKSAKSSIIGNDGNDDKGNLNQAVLQGNRNADFPLQNHSQITARDTMTLMA